jgi:hypothetical protein
MYKTDGAEIRHSLSVTKIKKIRENKVTQVIYDLGTVKKGLRIAGLLLR